MNRMDQVLPFGLTADGLLVALVASMAFFSVLAVWYALLEKHPMERRARLLATRRDEREHAIRGFGGDLRAQRVVVEDGIDHHGVARRSVEDDIGERERRREAFGAVT